MRFLSIIFFGGVLLGGSAFAQDPENPGEKISFRAVDVFVDSKDQHLAAYQVVVAFFGPDTKISGIEGGDPPAFRKPPLYDPKAIQKERVIIAAYNTGIEEELPKGKVRVATIHLHITGSKTPELTFKLVAAGTVDGVKITPTVAVEWRKQGDEDRE